MRSGVILAGGDGTRLRAFIHRLRGDGLPKQFVRFFDEPSMFERTVSRVERLIPTDRLVTVVGRHHLAFPEAVGQLASRPPGTVIVQPQNKETAPGVLLPLAHVAAGDPDAVVAIFPSDHFVAEEERFMGYVDAACREAEQDGSRIILIGAQPHGPEAEYGYIVPDARHSEVVGNGVLPVASFVEKPSASDAARLIRDGALWNTFVMVARASTLWALVRWCSPCLYHEFLKIKRAIGTRREAAVTAEVYQNLTPVNFSRGVLEKVALVDPRRVAVMPARGVFWSDWGSEERLLADRTVGRPDRSAPLGPPRPATVPAGRLEPRTAWADTA